MKRNKINLSNYKLTTADMGQLIPVQMQEILPGDTMKLSTSALIRVAPMLAPVMHPCTVRFHHWFVPTRLLWSAWEDFITGGPDNDNADTIPQKAAGAEGFAPGGILDHLGVPPSVPSLSVNALPLRAYNMIYNEFYRDQDLQEERIEGDNSVATVSWRKDYFTTARPWTQKGSDILIPIGTSAPVTGTITNTSGSSTSSTYDPVTTSGTNMVTLTGSGDQAFNTTTNTTSVFDLQADLTAATGISAVEFRELFALQRYNEARAQYGSRYSEYLRYLGVTPSDARLQRPEYLGGGKSTLQFSEVVQTGATTSDEIGHLAGHGITALKTRNTKRFFEEHGYMLTLMSVVPKSIYQDGVARTWLRQDKEDFYQRELQNVGQQAIKQGEIDASNHNTLHDTFGYSDRYADYRSTPSTVSGEFRTTLDFWHLARKFETPPLLNDSFVACVPTKRIHAVQSQNVLWCMVNNSAVTRRMVASVSIGKLS